jgi:hypothetical protein
MDPIDALWTGVQISNAVVTLTNGISIATYGSSGITMKSGGKLVSFGHPTNFNKIFRFNCIQESTPNTNWTPQSGNLSLLQMTANETTLPEISLRFTSIFTPADSTTRRHLMDTGNRHYGRLALQDCDIRNIYLYAVPAYSYGTTQTFGWTNNIFARCYLDPRAGYAGDTTPFYLYAYNNLFSGSTFAAGALLNTTPWVVKDNFFESSSASIGGSYFTAANNGYYNTTSLGGSSNITVPTLDFVSGGPLGDFYYPTTGTGLHSLVNAGSRSAPNATMYHFTTDATLNTREGSSTVDIGFHYAGVNASALVYDDDNDGLISLQEDANGNGTKDTGETDFNDPDTDGDGQSDYQEYLAETDPLNDQSVAWTRLAWWRFTDTNFLGSAGQVPLSKTNVLLTAGDIDNAGDFSSTNNPVLLNYRGIEGNGLPNVCLKRGSIRFRFIPYWFSDDTNLDSGSFTRGGVGPQVWVTLFQSTNFAIRIDPKGTNLVFTSDNGSGGTTTNLQSYVTFPSASLRFHRTDPGVMEELPTEVLFTYSTASSSITINGVLAATGSGLAGLAGLSARNQVVSIGSGIDGTGKMGGWLDEVETFNVPITLGTNTWNLSAVANPSPPSIKLEWLPAATNQVFYLKRRPFGGTDWTLLNPVTGTNYLDFDIIQGERYEYSTLSSSASEKRFITATFLGKPIEDRGKLVLLVDKTITNTLRTEIGTFVTNLIGDGWAILRADVPRHIDDYSSNTSYGTNWFNITNEIKPFIITNYNLYSTNLKGILVLGHVSIPYTGSSQPDDGHDHNQQSGTNNHEGAWSSDLFYGDTDGVWTDTLTNFYSRFPENYNAVNDGKMDQDRVPTNAFGIAQLEIPISRIDFARLPIFQNTNYSSRSETDLLRDYLEKDRRYRFKEMSWSVSGMAGDYIYGTSGWAYEQANMALSLFSVMQTPTDGDVFRASGAFLLGTQEHYGDFDTIQYGTGFPVTSTNFASGSIAPNCAFYMFIASFMPDWNLQNDLMRATLTPTNGGLVVMWNTRWRRWDPVASGHDIGRAFLQEANTATMGARKSSEPLGDMTLRYPIAAPPLNLTLTTNGGNLNLTWQNANESSPFYLVYRTPNLLISPLARLTATPFATTNFVDISPPSGALTYGVRTVVVATNGSGTFTNLSQSSFISR